jgi:hypothetical protein
MVQPNPNGQLRTAAQRRRASARRFELLNAFWDQGTAGDLFRTDALVWLALWQHARPDRTVCISFGTVAKMLKCHRETAYRSIRRLRKARLLKLVRRGGRDQGPNVYKLLPYDPTRTAEPDERGVSAGAYRV